MLFGINQLSNLLQKFAETQNYPLEILRDITAVVGQCQDLLKKMEQCEKKRLKDASFRECEVRVSQIEIEKARVRSAMSVMFKKMNDQQRTCMDEIRRGKP